MFVKVPAVFILFGIIPNGKPSIFPHLSTIAGKKAINNSPELSHLIWKFKIFLTLFFTLTSNIWPLSLTPHFPISEKGINILSSPSSLFIPLPKWLTYRLLTPRTSLFSLSNKIQKAILIHLLHNRFLTHVLASIISVSYKPFIYQMYSWLSCFRWVLLPYSSTQKSSNSLLKS